LNQNKNKFKKEIKITVSHQT